VIYTEIYETAKQLVPQLSNCSSAALSKCDKC